MLDEVARPASACKQSSRFSAQPEMPRNALRQSPAQALPLVQGREDAGLRSELQRLKFLDAKARKECLERKDDYRREELQQHIENRNQRMELLRTVKDVFQQQRRALLQPAESRRANARPAPSPGPGQYDVRASSLRELPQWKISSPTSARPEYVDAMVKTRAFNPSPGSYFLEAPTRASPHTPVCPSSCFRTTMIDEVVRVKEAVPAPGQYTLQASRDLRGPVLKRPYVEARNGAQAMPTHRSICSDAGGRVGRTSMSLPLLLAP